VSLTLLELNPQTAPQYGFPRRNGATASGTIGIHTAENRPDLAGVDTGAEDVAQFILTRTDFGSYHTLCDADSTIRMAPFDFETWGITSMNNWAIHIAGAVKAAHWAQLPTERREATVSAMALAAAHAAQWCFESLGIVVPARRLTRAEALERRPGFVAHADADPARRTDPGDHFDWDRFFGLYRAAMRERDIDVTLGQDRDVQDRGGGSCLALFVDGDFVHRTITEHERALARSGHYRGAIEEDHGQQAVAGPVFWKAYQQFLADAAFYSGRIDGDFGSFSTKAEQRFLAAAGLYRGTIDGDRGKVTVKALQGALNRGSIGGSQTLTQFAEMVNPAAGRVTSEYGPRKLMGNTFHSGLDIANANGTDVRAAFDGTVVEVGANIEPGRSGNAIRIRSDQGGNTYYGHLSAMRVRAGQHVSRGDHIGEMGATGKVTGPHLHFEVWSGGGGASHHDPRIDFRRFGVDPGRG
jgi:hypothetical protein